MRGIDIDRCGATRCDGLCRILQLWRHSGSVEARSPV